MSGYKNSITDINGLVGIGNASPSEKLDVAGNAVISGNLKVDTNTLFVDAASNYVGVGKIPAARKLEVQQVLGGNAAAFGLFEGSGSLTSVIGLEPSTNDFQVANTAGIRFYAGSTIGNIITEPTNERMRIYTGGDISFRNSSASEAFYWDASAASLGIGTTFPSSKLHIALSGGSAQLTLERTGSGAGKAVLAGAANGLIVYDDAFGVKMYVGTSGSYNGRMGLGTITPENKIHVFDTTTTNGQMLIQGDTNDTYIRYNKSNSTWSTGIDAGDSNKFKISNNSDIGTTTRMVIDTSGNVGIGTTSPTNKLTIQSNSTQLRLETASDPGGYYSFIESNYNAANPLNIYSSAAASYAMGTISLSGITGVNTYLNSYYGIIFGTSASLISAPTVRMMITNNGDVGIGTTSPGYKLDINGITRFQNVVRFATNVWNLSDDGFNRFYFSPSGRTYFGSGGGYEWRSAADSGMAVITDAGSMGIGTTNPLYKLDVNGSFNTLTSGVNLTYDNGIIYHGSSYYQFPSGSYYLLYGRTGMGLIFGSNNAEVGRFDLSGNFGIGTASPQAKLHVRNSTSDGIILSTTTNAEPFIALQRNIGNSGVGVLRLIDGGNLYFDNGATGAAQSTKMVITSSGNVGIGTTTPNFRLDVEHNGDSSNGIQITNTNTGTGARSTLELVSDSSQLNIYATSAAYSGVTGWGDSGVISSSTSASGGLILNAQSNGISFQGATSTRMFIATGGNVGIGTTSPSYKLDVNGQISSNNSTAGLISTISGTRNVNIQSFSGDWNYIRSNGANLVFGTQDNSNLYIRTNDSDRIIVTTAGNVGIGTTSPSEKLEVNGKIRANRNYIYGQQNHHIELVEDTNNTYLGNVNGSAYIATGSYFGSQIYNVSATQTALASVYLEYTGDILFLTQTVTAGSSTATAVEKVRIKANGNVGIGTTTPAYKLEVNGSLRSSNITVADGMYHEGDTNTYVNFLTDTIQMATSGVVRAYITSSGSVGIGTTSPTSTLHVNGETAAFGNSVMRMYINRTGSNVGSIIFTSGTPSVSNGWAEIGQTDADGDLYFKANPSAATYTPRMVIKGATGNIGIGTTSPGDLLHVVKDQTTDTSITVSNNGSVTSTTSMSFTLGPSAVTPQSWFRAYRDGSASTEIGFAQSLLFSGVIQAAKATRMVIDPDGDVGINVTNPTQKLHVDGNIITNNLHLQLNGNIQKIGSGSTLKVLNSNAITEMFVNGSGNLGIGIQNDTALAKVHVGGDFGSIYTNDASTGPLLVHNTSTNTSSYGIKVKLDAGTFGAAMAFWQGSTLRGYIGISSGGTTYSTSSDYRLKENVVALEKASETLMQLRPKRFNFIGGDGTLVDGFLAHEVKEYVPGAVQGNKDAVDTKGNPVYQGIDHSKLVPLLTAALQEALLRIEALEQQINNS